MVRLPNAGPPAPGENRVPPDTRSAAVVRASAVITLARSPSYTVVTSQHRGPGRCSRLICLGDCARGRRQPFSRAVGAGRNEGPPNEPFSAARHDVRSVLHRRAIVPRIYSRYYSRAAAGNVATNCEHAAQPAEGRESCVAGIVSKSETLPTVRCCASSGAPIAGELA